MSRRGEKHRYSDMPSAHLVECIAFRADRGPVLIDQEERRRHGPCVSGLASKRAVGNGSHHAYNAHPPRSARCVMRLNLKVPFAEKDDAKKLGARWDAGRKLWYIDGHLDATLFSRWQPTPHDGSAVDSHVPQRSASRPVTPAGKVHVGSRFVELPRVCDCLPWDDCEKCRLSSWPK